MRLHDDDTMVPFLSTIIDRLVYNEEFVFGHSLDIEIVFFL